MTEISLSQAMDLAQSAARMAGQVLKDMLMSASVREKAPRDLVTDADLAAQKVIESMIYKVFPNHRFLGEEGQLDSSPLEQSDDWIWLVDPLDGTTNYVHRFPNFAVSIGLVRNNAMVLGVVYDPMSDELFEATSGGGAYRNGIPIRVSKCQSLGDAMVAASFPPLVRRDSPEVLQFLDILERSQSVRRLGSAALNLCFVAMGRLDAYWANSLKPWDVAAGALIAQESGAYLRGLGGRDFSVWKGELLVAASNSLGTEMQACLG